MFESITASGQFVPALLGGMISRMEAALILLFLGVAFGMKSVLEDEIGDMEAKGLAFGIWFVSSLWTYFWL
jgi:hypothetical protein